MLTKLTSKFKRDLGEIVQIFIIVLVQTSRRLKGLEK